MEAGKYYIIDFGHFTGPLRADANGFYLSHYRDGEETVSVTGSSLVVVVVVVVLQGWGGHSVSDWFITCCCCCCCCYTTGMGRTQCQ